MVSHTHPRDDTDTPERNTKRLKTNNSTNNTLTNTTHLHPPDSFAPGLLDHNSIARLNASYSSASPFKHAVVEQLFNDDLLKGVKDECLNELSFTEKETDIYKINQTGDLASLNYLAEAQLALFPNLLTLRNALYSSEFRSFLRAVTGCGPLSGIKQDMSVAQYTKSCHLLNHDDVIGTRRVSYILYLPLPDNQVWQKEWGGALELYPTRPVQRTSTYADETTVEQDLEPECMPSKIIPPSWNQFVFFEVQPGESFHSVEEVVVGDDTEFLRTRMSISGWFHAAQEGEEGYVSEYESQSMKSSRDQLAATQTSFTGYPASIPLPVVPSGSDTPTSPLSESEINLLTQFMNPVYLQPRTMSALAQRFVDTSSLDLHHFLKSDLAQALDNQLRITDERDGLSNKTRGGKVPAHTSGVASPSPFVLKGPPHKHRYVVLAQSPSRAGSPSSSPSRSSPIASTAIHPLTAAPVQQILHTLETVLFPSPAFRTWLSCVAKLVPLGYNVEARRFRPGLDYMLARSEEKEARLDVCLGLTPDSNDSESGWASGEWGGWECYMAPHDEEDDPAVYRSGGSKKPVKTSDDQPEASTSNGHTNGHANGHANGKTNGHHMAEDSDDEPMEALPREEEEEEDDSTLLTVQPGYNKLLLVLRDERVMRFVKYVSAAAAGSRWDVCAEYEVGQMTAEAEEEGEDESHSETASASSKQ